jgi:hypothetical protein
MNEKDYAVLGLVEKWETLRLNNWRGTEIIGTFTDNGKEMVVSFFVPDRLKDVLMRFWLGSIPQPEPPKD